MQHVCPKCGLPFMPGMHPCRRHDTRSVKTENIASIGRFLKSPIIERAKLAIFASLFTLSGFYVSMVVSGEPLLETEAASVRSAIGVLEKRGFSGEAAMLSHLTVYHRSDNWLNSAVFKESAYAATNFPFEIITLYHNFHNGPVDDVERAAILLHEAKHLEGANEPSAYEYVWLNRARLGWTEDRYGSTELYGTVSEQTRDYVPHLFVCIDKPRNDCTR